MKTNTYHVPTVSCGDCRYYETTGHVAVCYCNKIKMFQQVRETRTCMVKEKTKNTIVNQNG